MAVNTQVSVALSFVLSLLLFSGCQTFRVWLSATPLRTILGGYITSWLFITLLTLVGNVESLLLGKNSQAGLFPEVTIALMGALTTAGLVHRVCVTTCLLFSGIALYYINGLSQKHYVAPAPQVAASSHKKKRNN